MKTCSDCEYFEPNIILKSHSVWALVEGRWGWTSVKDYHTGRCHAPLPHWVEDMSHWSEDSYEAEFVQPDRDVGPKIGDDGDQGCAAFKAKVSESSIL